MTPWNETQTARAVLDLLRPTDLRIVAAHDTRCDEVLQYAPATDLGRSVWAQLEQLHVNDAAARLFTDARTDEERNAATRLVEQRATVEGTVAQRFGSANQFAGSPPFIATRRFHANAGHGDQEVAA